MQKNISSNNIVCENCHIVGPPSPLNIPNDCVPSDEAFEIVAENLINDVVLDFCFQVQRASRVWLFKSEVDENVENQTEDIFGQVKGKIKSRVSCPHCPAKVEARRFAKHLEKCNPGTNRQSSRKATKRLNPDTQDSDIDDEDDIDSDVDASYGSSSRKKSKKKQTKVGNRKRATKDPLGLSSASAESTKKQLLQMFGSYEQVFNQLCGVRSRHTKKMCMNTPKCSQHTEELKIQIRKEFMPNYVAAEPNDPPIDVVHTVDEESSVVNLSRSISRGSSPEFNNSE